MRGLKQYMIVVLQLIIAVVVTNELKAQNNCVTGDCNPNTYFYSTDPNTIEYDNIVSVFHSSMFKEPGGVVRVWGQGTAQNGQDVLTTSDAAGLLSGANFGTGTDQLTGTVLKFAGASSSSTQQFAVLTTSGLYVWGNSGILVPAVANAATGSFRKVAIGTYNVSGGATKADGLPAGVNPTDVKMMFGTREGLAIVTCTGAAYTLTTNGVAYGDGVTDNSTNDLLWHRVSTAANTPLTNVVAVRGTYQTFMALTSDGKIYTWGTATRINGTGGAAAAQDRSFATEINQPTGVTPKMIGMTASSNGKTYYLLATNGKLFSMGDNTDGQLGNGSTTSSDTWIQVTATTTAEDAATYAIDSNVVWISPQEHDRGTSIQRNASISIITNDGKVWSWGGNNASMLGITAPPNHISTPSLMPGRITGTYDNTKLNLSDVILAVETGGHTTLLIKQCSKKFGYVGHRIHGSMGDGTTTDQAEPIYNFGNTGDVIVCGAPTTPLVHDLNVCPTAKANLADAVTGTTPAGFTLQWWTTIDRATGTQVGTPSSVNTGTYYGFYVANSGPCSDPSYSKVIVTDTKTGCLDAVNDTYGTYNGFIGGITPSVLTNDSLNHAVVNPASITLTAGTSPLPGQITMNGNGTISVAAGTPAGIYNYPYTICENLNPTNCDNAVATVTVGAANIDAVNDNYGTYNGIVGGTTPSVLTNDSLNHAVVNPASITLTAGTSPLPGQITMNGNGTITVAAGTPAGTYNYPYTICENLNPSNCDNAVATVTVGAANIDAVNDNYGTYNGIVGGTTPSVLTNDSLNHAVVNPASITLTAGTSPLPGQITMNGNGTISVAAGTPAGTYNYPYTICENLNPTNCDNAVATVTVGAANIDAVNDNYGTYNGIVGGTTPSVLTNDSLNHAVVNPASITLTAGTSPLPGKITMNGNGTISVAAGTPAGTYNYPYTICENLNPSNCDNAVATVTVGAANIDAVNDNYGTYNGIVGGTTPSVLTNDSLNHAVVNPASITLTAGTSPLPGKITMNGNGTISVAAGTPAGIYNYPYTICENLNPSNCDDAIAYITVLSPTDTIIDTLCITCIDTICLDDPFGPGSVVTTTLCDGTTSMSGSVADITILANGCIEIEPTNIGRDTICIIQCDAVSGICDTTILIVMIPPTIDTIRDTLLVDSTLTVCVTLENGFNPLTTTYTYCDGSTGTLNGTLGSAVLGTDGCITYTAGSVSGNEDPICVVACDASLGICDTTYINIHVKCLPTVDTIYATSCNPADTGTVVQTLTGANGCDSVVTTITTLLPSTATTVNATSCNPADTGTVVQTLTGANGCDSVVTTITTLLPSTATTVNATSCNPADTGTVVQTLTGANGCDSVVTTITTLLPSTATTVNATSCNPADTGTVVQTLTGANGCDSVVTTITTLLPSTSTTVNATSCNPADTGTVVQTLTGANGCDSVVTTITTLLPSTATTVNATSCNPADTGTVVQTLIGVNGCDSVVTTITTLLPSTSTTVNATSCNPADTGTVVQTLIGANGCDSVVTTITTLLPSTATTVNATSCNPADTGTVVQTLTGANGCDSVVTTITTLLPSTATTVNATSCNPADTGTVVQTLTGANGCDSVVTTITTLRPSTTSNQTLSVCFGGSVTVCGKVHNATGTYVDTCTATNGCDSIITLNLTVLPLDTQTIVRTICFGDSVLVGTSVYKTTGVTVDTLTNANNCDSIITLNLTVLPLDTQTIVRTICFGDSVVVGTSVYKTTGITVDTLTNANNCDSIITLNLTVLPLDTQTIVQTICFGDSVVVGTSVYKTTGITVDTLTNANNCDSIITLNLTVLPLDTQTIVQTICFGDSVLVGTSVYKTTGITVDTLTNANNCDSIITLNLTVLPLDTQTIVRTICYGDSVVVGTKVHNTTGITVDTLTNANNCDSIITLNLTVLPLDTQTIVRTICFGDSVLIGTKVHNTTGVTVDTLTNANNCDSIITLNLTVLPLDTQTIVRTICFGDSVLIGTKVHNTTGVTVDTLTNANNCDSIITLNLTVLPLDTQTIVQTICFGDSVLIGTKVHNTTGVTVDTLTNANNCDSIITLNLTVLPLDTQTIVQTICFGDSVLIGTKVHNTTGVTTDTLTNANNCDSIITLNLTVLPLDTQTIVRTICFGDSVVVGTSVYKTTGITVDTLTNANNCDSIITLNLTVLPLDTQTIVRTICYGDSVVVGTKVHNTTGITVDTLTNANNCDSIITLNLTVLPLDTQTIVQTICFGDSVVVGTKVHNTTGVTVDTLTNANNCDSIITLNLTVLPLDTQTIVQTICFGDSVVVGTKVHNTTGVTVDTLTNANNCDSIITLNLTVLPLDTQTIVQTICFGDSVVVGTKVHNTTGVTTDTLTNANNCDSIITLNLTVLPLDTQTIVRTICFGDSVVVGTSVYKTTGITVDTLTNANNCDSIITLNLTVLPLDTQTIVRTICYGDSVVVGTKVHNTTGITVDTLTNANNCDSIITLNLTVRNLDTITKRVQICLNDSISVCGKIYKESGTYIDTCTNINGCDSIITTILTSSVFISKIQNVTLCLGDSLVMCSGKVYKTAGIYKDTCMATAGCDSIITTTVTVSIAMCIDTIIVVPVCDTCTETACIDTIYNITNGHWTLCDGSQEATSGLGTYSIDSTTGCITYTSNGVIGRDSLCVIVCDSTKAVCDTITIEVPIIPTRDTIRDTVKIGDTDSVCVAIEVGMNADSVSIVNCAGTLDNITTPIATNNGNCINVVYTGTAIGEDKFCVVVCDTTLGVCDTTEVIITVIPKDTIIVVPVCDTCTETACIDTIYNITNGHWTLCDGSQEATSSLGTYSIDSTTGCITYTSNGIIGRDSLCVVVCDSTKAVCDTITIEVPIIPTRDTIRDTVKIGDTDSVCVAIEVGMNADTSYIINCAGALDNITTPTATQEGNCISIKYTGTNIGEDKFCVVVCDTTLGVCDTTEVIITVIPKDTIIVVPVCDTCTETACIDTIYNITNGHWTLCDGSQTATSGLGTYSIDSTTGCITYTSNGVIGRDSLCVVVCDSTKAVCDTITIEVPIIPTRDTIRDTVKIGDTDSVCVAIEVGMNADTSYIINCAGALDNITTPTATQEGNCISIKYTGTNIGEDKFCVVVCDTTLGVCDTTEVIITVIPKDTIIVVPVCDTCTETACIDTIYNITNGHWTLCDGSQTATSGLGTYSIDSTTGCITYTSNGVIGRDSLCVVVCDSTKAVCDTITIEVPIIPTRDTIRDTVKIGDTDSVCVAIEVGMNADTSYIINCAGALDNITTPTATQEGNCISIKYTGTNIGEDKFCVVVCDTVLGVCDTTEVIITVIPKDTIIVVPVCDTCTETACIDTIYNITNGHWTLCDGSQTATSGLGTYSIDSTTGCITYTSNGIIGRDSLCVIVCDSTKAVCDTITIEVPIIPTRDTIRDTVKIGDTDSVCVAIEVGMNADTNYIINCAGTLDNITTPTATQEGNCISIKYTGTNIGEDKFCVVVCDTTLGVCDTTEVIITVIPKDTIIVVPVCDTCTETACIDTIYNITNGHWTLCDGSQTATSGLGTYSIDSTTGCITYTSNGVIGRDSLCVVVCDSTKAVCDTITIEVPIIPTRDTIRDTVKIGDTDSVCVAIEVGMNADTSYIINCAGALDNITTPTATQEGNCISIKYTGTNIGEDKFCVVVCDTVLGVCDTTEVIITVIPKDTIIVVPVCDTCTETACIDTIYNITNGHWTLCDGSQTATSGLGTYSIDSTTGCITYTSNGIIGRDSLCVIVCDSTKAVCDTITIEVPIIPTRDTIRDTVKIGDTDSVCVAIEVGMNADTNYIINCAGTLDNITTPTATQEGNCISIKYTGTNIGEDKFCVVVCDTVLGVCDTTEVIITVIPKDTIIIVPVCDTCTETACIDTIYNITNGHWTLCDGSQTATSGLGTYSIDSTTGCITYTSNGIIGRDSLCVIVCDSTKAVCDTITIEVPIIPTRDTIRDTVKIGDTDSVCVAIEVGMNADSVSIVNCAGTLDNITTPIATNNGNCINVVYTGTAIGEDKFCVVVCDTTLGVCDTTEVIITVIPKDTIIVVPVCDTCTETACIDTIYNITNGHWTLCDGSQTATSGLGTYSIDSTTGCITYTSNGIIGRDSLCVVVCDSTKAVCDTITIEVPIIPTRDTIRDTVKIGDTDSVCVAIEVGMNADTNYIINCAGALDNITTPTATQEGNCISIKYTGTNIGEDKFCVVVCDTTLKVCDTTEVIITVIPKDTIIIVPVCDTCTETACIDTIYNITNGHWTLCDGSQTATSGLGAYSIDSTTGCITYTSNGIIGRDSLCVVVCDSTKAVCDTITIEVPIIPTRDTIRDTVKIGDTDSVCVAIEVGMNADTNYIINCAGALDNITTPTATQEGNCISIKYTGTNIGEDKFCVVVCDTVLGVCDTTEVIITVIPKDTIIIVPVCDTCTVTTCIDTIYNITNGHWTLCDGSQTATSGLGTYSIDSTTGCITYTSNGVIGRDSLCVVVCDSTKAVCDTITIEVPIIPTRDTIRDTVKIGDTDSVCVAIEVGMNADTSYIINCAGALDNITTPTATQEGNCISIKYTGTNIGEDKFCVVVCDTTLGVCDTTEVIITVIPKDTIIVVPVCDTCTETACIDTIYNITNGHWTLCDGSQTATSGLGTYSIDSTTGCITYTSNGVIGRDSLCVVVCDSTKAVCDTITIEVPIIPTRDTIRDTVKIGDTDSVCVAIEVGMNADTSYIINCAGALDNITTPTATQEGNCISIKYTGTNIGEDKFCVVVCDTVLGVCDTTEVIITVIPKDTIIVVPVCDTCTETACIDTIYNITNGHWTLCDGSQTATSGLGTYSIDSTTGCITYTSNGIIGRDSLCVIVCDSTKAVCDTITIEVPIIPTRDTIRDTVKIGDTDSVCVAIEVGMNADTNYIINCAGTLDNITTPTATQEGNCISIKYTGTNIGEDKFCVVVCDTVLGVCDTTEVIITVIPKDTIIIVPVCDTCTETACIDTIYNITNGHWTLCDGSQTATSGLGTYSIDSTTGCITYTSNGIIGRDSLCVVVCDSTKAVCDTITIEVPIIPTRDTIRDTVKIGDTDSVCVAIEVGMNADTSYIINCAGALDNITTPTATNNGSCISIKYTGTNIGEDKFCVVVCDTTLGVCDTTEVIITVIPKDTIIIVPVCDTCTETACIDTIYNITNGHWTLCDGSQEATSGLGTYSIDSTTGCITYTSNGIIGRDSLCVVVCDSTKAVCDTITIEVPIIPTRDTIRDTVKIGDTDSVCVAIEVGMNADTSYIINCAGALDNITTPTATQEGNCISIKYTGTNIGEDKFCVVVCDTVLGVCDTTEVIITVIPKDTIIVIPVCDTCTETACIDTIYNITNGHWTLCDGSQTATSGLGTYSIDSTTGCITYTSNGIIGRDSLCVVVCDSTKAVCDTITIEVPIIPTRDTIRDTVKIGDTDSVCVAIEVGMNADTSYIINCAGALDNITTPTATQEGNCISIKYTGTNIGEDKFCVVVCDTVLGVCDTTEVIITVIPKDTIIVVPVCDTCTETACIDTIYNITNGHWTLCDGSQTATSGLGTYSIDSTTGCITYTSNGIIGRDSLCVVVCDSTKAVCDTITIEVPIIPTRDTIRDTVKIGDTDSVCVKVEVGMNADTSYIINCAGALDNISTPTATQEGNCISIKYTGTNIGEDKFCVVVCDTTLGVCDTTEVIITVIPKDTIIIVPVCDTCTETACIDTIYNITNGHWTLCDGSQEATSGLGTYSIDSTTGCITYTSNGIIGRDSLCVIVCDSTKAVCDTITIEVPIIPTRDTIRDTVKIGDTDSVCVAIEVGMNADTSYIINCAGALDNITTPTATQEGNCISIKYTGTNIGEDKFCVVVCDTVLDVCDTTEVIITVIPKDTIIECDSLIKETYVEISCEKGIGNYCLPIDLKTLQEYNVYIDGSMQALSFSLESSCGEVDAAGAYSFDANEYLDGVQHVLERWGIDSNRTLLPNIRFTTLEELAVYMNSVDAQGMWYAEDMAIKAGNPSRLYNTGSGLAIFALDPVLGTFENKYNNYVEYTGTKLAIPSGCHWVVVEGKESGCRDSVRVCVVGCTVKDTIRDTTCYNCPVVVCVDTLELPGTVISITTCDTDNKVTIDGLNPCITYTPSNGQTGNDTTCIVVCDDQGYCDTTIIIITVETPRDTIRDSLPVNSVDSICDFLQPRGTDITVTSCAGQTSGTGNYITWTINEQGCLVYTAGNVKGTDTLCIMSCITGTDTCIETTVYVTVTGIPPIAINNDTTTKVNVPVVINVIGNDIQTDSDPLQLCDDAIVTYPVNGTLSNINTPSGNVTYTPNTDFTGVDSFQYVICDPDGNDTAWAYVRIVRENECELYDAFSPNGDGVNDYYTIPCPSSSAIVFCVYNRWGIEVYRNEDYRGEWDGRYKGAPLPDGTYYYVIKYINSGGDDINKAGFIVIHR